MRERRAYTRVPAGVEAQFQVLQDVDAPRLALTKDISLSGMRFTPSEKLDPGSKVFVTLFLPKEGQVNLSGVVAWAQGGHGDREGYDVGLRWSDVSPVAQARLNSFITDRTRSGIPISESLRLHREPPAVHWGRVGLYAAIGAAWRVRRVPSRLLNSSEI